MTEKENQTLLDMTQHVYKKGTEAADAGKYDEAISILNNINATLPVMTAAQLQAGRCHWEMHRWDQARRHFMAAAQLEPNNDDAAWTIGLLSLQVGDFVTGWKNYERRWGSKTFKSPKLHTKHPKWERNSGMRRPLVWCEQGLGDQILYASLIDRLAREVEHVTVMVDLRLVNLLHRGCTAENVTILSHNSRIKMSEHDSHIPIASLASYFIESVWDIPDERATHYIKADPHRVTLLAKELRLTEKCNDRVIGLTWASTAPIIGPHKSVGLDALRPLFDLPNTKFLNLQYGEAQKEGIDFHPNLITTHIDTFLDLENVAALIELCDVVVSPSGANVHLAGAMGKPVMLLDSNKLWYWNHKSGSKSLWYPNVEIYQRENMNAPWDLQVKQIKEWLDVFFDDNPIEEQLDTFVFFHVGDDISYPQKMVKSLLRHNPGAFVIMCTDTNTPDVMGVSERFEVSVDRDNIIYERVKAFAKLNLPDSAMYLDTDMIFLDRISIDGLMGECQVAVCKRTLQTDAMFNTSQRGIDFSEYEGKTIDEVYPYIACATATTNGTPWREMLDLLEHMDPKYRRWYGDQEALKAYAKMHTVHHLPESVYGCLPEFQQQDAKILHFKGPSRKKQFESI